MPAPDWFRESFVGILLRGAFGPKLDFLKYPEEIEGQFPEQYTKEYIERETAAREQEKEENQRRQERGRTRKDPNVVTWYSDIDPENPANWSLGKRCSVTALICLLTFAVYIGSSIYSPGIPDIEQRWGITQVPATLGLTAFVAGYGIGPMFLSPLSEIPAIGRNTIYIICLIIFVCLQVPTALCGGLGALIPLRFAAGFVGSPPLATGGASIGDMFGPKKRAYPIAIWGCAAVCGPVLGPLLGGFAADANGWRWTFWVLLWLSGGSLLILAFFLPETSAENILVKRARRLRKLTGNKDLKSEGEIEQSQMTVSQVAVMSLWRPFQLTFGEPIVFLLDLYIALVYGILYIWFESFAIVFTEFYGFNLGEEGLAFMGILVMTIITTFGYFAYSYFYLEKKFDDEGNLRPVELRLQAAMFASIWIPICLFWFGWTSRPRIHWIVPIIGSSFFSVGAFLLFQCVINYLGDAYPKYAASVYAGNDFFRAAFGAGFPLIATPLFANLGIGWGCSLLGFISVGMIPIPFVLYRYGGWLRKKSKYAKKHD
ncbi:MFS general substrate transporter [Saitoella complicata NRRL Y-17804]|uniref:MFS general substrate transporter n=1 Tax=Saitoella complicata (strain BCRC 22490 / CBS 7301 / JCM 7358 / NBRC 10748 / NRRL Y-17804) TaxID=698492 RepID=UPI000867A4E3|nr:MFS general substrate transporter [Saitoella complicata NRRL Y-17804]ODQ50367.1 MFS general substrate transporter [Saitoella complicata NRRL Y-17804]